MYLLLALGALSLEWIAPPDPRLAVHGLPWYAENEGEAIRLPQRLKATLPAAVWNLGRSPSGGRIRCRTNSPRLAIRLEYAAPPNMTNMHAFGQSGVDLYLDGVYHSTVIAPKDAAPGKLVEHVLFADLPRQDREVTFYLPLYQPVTMKAVGIEEGSPIGAAKRFALPKPVVFYGTSITQGCCASRSGLSYQAILGRQMNLDFVNLGFSGNGKGEPEVARMVAEIDAAAFVVDFSQNNPTIESLRGVYGPFLETLRQAHPQTPIIAITPIAMAREAERIPLMRQHIREVVRARLQAGDTRLTLVEGLSLLGPNRLDGLVDGVHPNDLGFAWMAEGLGPHLAGALSLPPPTLVDDRRVTVTSTAIAVERREQIVRYIWGAAGRPRGLPVAAERNAASPVPGLRHLKSVETFTIRMEAGQENTTHHFVPRKSNGQLMVLQHGHACTFDDARDPKGAGMAHAIDRFLEGGYAVLAAYMPHMRPGDCRTMPHAELFRLPLSGGSALKFFLEPVAISLNAVRGRYKKVHMAGLSGGGWTTTLYAAIDPAIANSFPVAGSIPLYLRTGDSVGDKEQYLTPFYELAGYGDLYALGAWGRRQVQILNRRDDCCFGERQHDARKQGEAYEPAYRAYEQRVRQALGDRGTFRLEIDDSAPRHMISPHAVEQMLRELQQPGKL